MGEDWQMDYKYAGTIMNNHTCFLDPWVHGTMGRLPCFVMKEKDARNPLLSSLVKLYSALLIGKDKSGLIKSIIER